MALTDILFVDLLYQPKGSFDDDFVTIKSFMDGKSVLYLKVYKRGLLSPLFSVLSVFFRTSPAQIVFLSAKLWHLVVLIPLALLRPSYAIYHFRPAVRGRLHDRVLPWLAKVYRFAVYGDSVRRYLCRVTNHEIPLIAHRVVDKRLTIRKIRSKLEGGSLMVFCPGIKPGVRMPIPYDYLSDRIRRTLSRPVDKLIVQDSAFPTQNEQYGVTFVPQRLSDLEYSRLYDEALIIAMEFHPDYEGRSSAMINDALRSGCIVITDEHPITNQYGYPDGLVTDLDHLSHTIDAIRNGTIGYDQVPGFDYEEGRRSWMYFLGLDAQPTNP